MTGRWRAWWEECKWVPGEWCHYKWCQTPWLLDSSSKCNSSWCRIFSRCRWWEAWDKCKVWWVIDRTTKAREEDTIKEGIGGTGVILMEGEKEGIRSITTGTATMQVVNSKGLISHEWTSLTSRGGDNNNRVLAHSHNNVTNNHSSKAAQDNNNQTNSQTCNNNNRWLEIRWLMLCNNNNNKWCSKGNSQIKQIRRNSHNRTTLTWWGIQHNRMPQTCNRCRTPFNQNRCKHITTNNQVCNSSNSKILTRFNSWNLELVSSN